MDVGDSVGLPEVCEKRAREDEVSLPVRWPTYAFRKQDGRDEEERHGGDEGSADAKASKEDVKKTKGRRAGRRREVERAGLKPRHVKGGIESGKAHAQGGKGRRRRASALAVHPDRRERQGEGEGARRRVGERVEEPESREGAGEGTHCGESEDDHISCQEQGGDCVVVGRYVRRDARHCCCCFDGGQEGCVSGFRVDQGAEGIEGLMKDPGTSPSLALRPFDPPPLLFKRLTRNPARPDSVLN